MSELLLNETSFFLKFFAAFSFLKLELIALRIFAATGILLTSFFFVCKHRQQMSELLLSKWDIFKNRFDEISWMTKVWKSERILMRFLDSPPWANRSKGLEFTGILLTSFFFVRKHRQQMSGLLLSKQYWMTKVWKSENFWWDFLTHFLWG